jgi:hypothetical protein
MRIGSVAVFSSALFGLAVAQPGCYTSTAAIILAQALDPRGDDELKDYTICDNAEIVIGVPEDATLEDPSLFNFVDGDFPLGIIRPNVSVQCNGCVLKGGYLQVVTYPSYNIPQLTPFASGTDNLNINGITFTGSVLDVAGDSSQNILLTSPGKGMVIENCTFKDIYIEGLSLYAGQTLATGGGTGTPNESIEVTVRDSVFQNITSFHKGSSGALANILCLAQTCTFERLRFDGITAAARTISCNFGAICALSDICVSNADLAQAAFGYDGRSTIFETSNIHEGPNVVGAICPEGLHFQQDPIMPAFECLDPFDAPACSLGPLDPPSPPPVPEEVSPPPVPEEVSPPPVPEEVSPPPVPEEVSPPPVPEEVPPPPPDYAEVLQQFGSGRSSGIMPDERNYLDLAGKTTPSDPNKADPTGYYSTGGKKSGSGKKGKKSGKKGKKSGGKGKKSGKK